MDEWIIYDGGELHEGDIIETTTIYPLVRHYGVVVIQDEEKKIAHYPFPAKPKIEDIHTACENKKITRLIKSSLKSNEVIERHNEIAHRTINDYTNWFLKFNCEDYIRKITGKCIGMDQRATFLGIIIVILLLILIFRK